MPTADPGTRVRAVEQADDAATLLAAVDDPSPDVARAALHPDPRPRSPGGPRIASHPALVM